MKKRDIYTLYFGLLFTTADSFRESVFYLFIDTHITETVTTENRNRLLEIVE